MIRDCNRLYLACAAAMDSLSPTKQVVELVHQLSDTYLVADAFTGADDNDEFTLTEGMHNRLAGEINGILGCRQGRLLLDSNHERFMNEPVFVFDFSPHEFTVGIRPDDKPINPNDGIRFLAFEFSPDDFSVRLEVSEAEWFDPEFPDASPDALFEAVIHTNDHEFDEGTIKLPRIDKHRDAFMEYRLKIVAVLEAMKPYTYSGEHAAFIDKVVATLS